MAGAKTLLVEEAWIFPRGVGAASVGRRPLPSKVCRHDEEKIVKNDRMRWSRCQSIDTLIAKKVCTQDGTAIYRT